jgi:beta-barrel assembly-enhancing protease
MCARLSGLITGLCLTLAAAVALAQTPPRALSQKDDPSLIGQRNINRHQLNFYSLSQEVELGRQLAAEIEPQLRFVTDPVVTEYVNRLGQNLVVHSDARVAFTIKVIDSPEVNAFALPGGILYVTRGLLEFSTTEAELAGVMAHEIAHVAARHSVEQMSKARVADWVSLALSSFGGWGGVIIGQVASLAMPLGLLKFSRGAEKEADLLGAQYLWAAGYDPQALVSFIERFQAHEQGRPNFITRAFSTHPVMSDRVKKLRQLLDRLPEQPEYLISNSEFNEVRARAISLDETRHAREAPNRPSLKRRPGSTPADDAVIEEQTPDRPVLKHAEPAPENTGAGSPGRRRDWPKPSPPQP